MFEEKIEAMNAQTIADEIAPPFEKRVYTVEEIMNILDIGNLRCK